MSVGSSTYGGLGVLGILAGLSLLAESRAAALGACAVGTFLLVRYAATSRRFAMVAGSLETTRTVDAAVVRQDATVGVQVRVNGTFPRGCQVEVEDLPPAGVEVVRGSPSITCLGPLTEEGVISYSMTVPTEGEVFFRGVALRIHDPFFPRAATFKGEEVRLPTLEVRQERRFLSREGGRRDARPVSRPSLANTGETVRSFRKFGTGDDIRTIDWKISAKQGSLYVRVYADEEARPPLIFVDLPRKGASSRAQAAMKEAVRGAIAASVERHGRASLMAVRGPNLLVYLPLEADYARAMQALARSAGKATEEAHFYRARTPPSLRADLNAIMHRSGNGNGNGHGAAPAYRERLAAAYGSVLRGREQTVYERQVAQAVWRLRPHHIELFSCKDGGDQSHLEFVVYIAEYVGVQVDLWKQNGHGWAGVAGRTPPLKGAEVIR